MKDSFTNKVRTGAQSFRAQGRTFTSDAISEVMEVTTYGERERVRNALNDLKKTGEIKAVTRGVYTYAGRQPRKPSKQKVMWAFFRMRMKCGAAVTIEELQAAAGASADFVGEWLRFLVRIGYAKKLGNGKFQLLKDPVEMPTDDKKAARLRSLRSNKREEVMAILEEIRKMALRAEGIVGELSE